MLNSKFKAHFYRLSALALLLPISLGCLSLHSKAETETKSETVKQIKVQLYADDEALDFSLDKVNYLNFTATVGLVSPESAYTSDASFKIPSEDLVQLSLPESVTKHNFATDKELKANEFSFQAKRPTAWLVNLQLEGYDLVKTSYNADKQSLRLDYRPINKQQAYQANYFTGELNSLRAKASSNLKSERKNLLAVLEKAEANGVSNGVSEAASSARTPIYNLLNGQALTENKLADSTYLLGLAHAKEDLAPALQTLSYTLIYQGKAQTGELYNLPLAQTMLRNVYDKSDNVRHDSDRAENVSVSPKKSAQSDKTSSESLTQQTTASGDKVRILKVSTKESSKDTKDTKDKPALKAKDDKQKASAKAANKSKYKTKVIDPNNTEIVPSTGESAASIGLSLLCFISATAVYAIKRHFQ